MSYTVSSAKIQVLLPTYNAPYELRALLSQLAEQSFTNFVVSIGDNSEEPSQNKKIVADFSERITIHYHHHTRNIGALANHHFLLDSVDLPYYCLLGSDDAINPVYLEALIAVAEESNCAVTVPLLKQYRCGALLHEGYLPDTRNWLGSLIYCLTRSKRFARLEGIFYALLRNNGRRPRLANRLGAANRFILDCALFGAMKSAPLAVYSKHYDQHTAARHRQLRRISLFHRWSTLTRTAEIYPYIALNALQAIVAATFGSKSQRDAQIRSSATQ